MAAKKDNRPLGLYLHIPFCHARCGYCDFVTFTGKDDQRQTYAEKLSDELALYGSRTSRPISTVFFGGGTPSVLEPNHIEAIFQAVRNHFRLHPGVEITLEANPESITPERLAAWREAGANRISIGLQAYDDALLKQMGRLHTTAQFEHAFQTARQAGFSNLSADLIYGFPGQTLSNWKATLEKTAALRPEHVSLYALVVEEHTPFAAEGHSVNPDLQAEMYAAAREYLPGLGYGQYEISNFALPGKECRHNLIYWRGEDYLGVGVGAVGCIEGLRWENRKNLGPYFKDVAAGRPPRQSEEQLTSETRRFERLMLGLRLREGFFWQETDSQWLAQRTRLASQGYLEEIRPDIWRITERFVPLTNQILLPFLPA